MKRLPKRKRERILEMFQQGVPVAEIARALDISQWSVGAEVEYYQHSFCPAPLEHYNFCPFCGLNLNSARYKQTKRSYQNEKA